MECWNHIPQHFFSANLDVSVVMPNHLHGIILLGTGGGGGGQNDGHRTDAVPKRKGDSVMFVSRRFAIIWLFAIFVVPLGGCDLIGPLHDRLHEMETAPEEKVDWVGPWSLESIDGVRLNDLDLFSEGEGAVIYAVASWMFEADGTWWASFRFEFVTKAGMGEEFSMWLSGTYVLDGANYVLNIETDAPNSVFASDENTGTWRIKDDTLTLTDDQGTVIVFRDGTELWLDDDPGPPEPQAGPLD